MGLTIVNEPEIEKIENAGSLIPGQWFIDEDNQIFVIALDDRTNEKRILCAGDFHRPFLINIDCHKFKVHRLLADGTVFKIRTQKHIGGLE